MDVLNFHYLYDYIIISGELNPSISYYNKYTTSMASLSKPKTCSFHIWTVGSQRINSFYSGSSCSCAIFLCGIFT